MPKLTEREKGNQHYASCLQGESTLIDNPKRRQDGCWKEFYASLQCMNEKKEWSQCDGQVNLSGQVALPIGLTISCPFLY